jgi:autotransporter passenger strand-loop-strand repeat protein
MSVFARPDLTLVSSSHDENGGVFDMPFGGAVVEAAVPSGETISHRVFCGDRQADTSDGQIVSSGQTASGGTIGYGQTQSVLSGGTDIGTAILGGTQSVYGTASSVSVGLDSAGNPGVETVYSGGRTIATTVAGTGEEIVLSGGTAYLTVVSTQFTSDGYAGGTLIVSSGGVAWGAIVTGSVDYPHLNTSGEFVLPGGMDIRGTVGAGGREYVSGTVSAITVSSGGYLELDPGGTASGVTVLSGGEIVFAGGTATDLVIKSGGLQVGVVVSSGQTASGVIVGSGAVQTVLSGGTTIAEAISGGIQKVYGVASGTSLSGDAAGPSAGVQYLYSGGVSISSVIGALGSEVVSSGGVASGTLVSDGQFGIEQFGGELFVSSGGVAYDVTVVSSVPYIPNVPIGVTIERGGEEVGATIGNLGREYVSGIAADVVVGSGGYLELDAGGNASGVTVSAGGAIVLDGGTVTQLTLQSGAVEIIQVVVSGQTVSGYVVNYYQTVLAGGTTIGTIVSGGEQIVYGLTSGTVLSENNFTRASQFVYSGGITSGTEIGSLDEETVFAGGTARGTIVSGGPTPNGHAGGLLVVSSGGVASGSIVAGNYSSDGEIVLSGAEDIGATVGSAGREFVSGTVLDVTVSSGGYLEIDSGGFASGVTILSGGEVVIKGATVSGLVLGSGAIAVVPEVASGQSFSGIVVSSGSQLVDFGGRTDSGRVLAGGTQQVYGTAGGTSLSGSTATSGALAEQIIPSDGVAVGTIVGSGGVLISIFGAVSNVTVSSGGNADQFAGAMSGVTLTGGHLTVVGGTATGISVGSGGFEFAGNFLNSPTGGTLISSVVGSGGILAMGVHGAVSRATISNGGILFELAGVTSGVVLSGGIQYVGGSLPGLPPPNPVPSAVASRTVVSGGGIEYVNSNGSAIGTSVLSGGEIVFNGGSVSGLSVSSGGAIDLAQRAYSSASSLSFTENAQNTGGVLTVRNGTGSFAVTLLGQYAAAGFHLAKDGGGGTVITYAPPTSALVLAAGQ